MTRATTREGEGWTIITGRLFGTDGVRGVANQDLSPLLAFRLGRAAGALLVKRVEHTQGRAGEADRRHPVVLVASDTRVSGGMLEAAITAGLTSVGVDVVRLGVLPTPGLSHLTAALEADAGVMVSASHNPVEDNGIKLFDRTGYKLPDPMEQEIEALVRAQEAGQDALPSPVGAGVGRVRWDTGAARRYEEFLAAQLSGELQGLRMVLDCANGAAYDLAPRLFARCGAQVHAMHTGSSGEDINVECGSTRPGRLQAMVRELGADLGLAFDGDADRCIAIDEQGQVVDGDQILAICALERLRRDDLPGRAVAATVYSNGGLVQALAREGGRVVFTPPGDRQVLEAMVAHGLVMGGEQSGHLIFLERSRTGDGLLTGLLLAGLVWASGRRLSELAAQMPRLPQVMINVRVRRRDGLVEHPEVAAAVRAIEERLGDAGRVYIRPSGTEPLIRVMVEGSDAAVVRQAAEELGEVIARAAADSGAPVGVG